VKLLAACWLGWLRLAQPEEDDVEVQARPAPAEPRPEPPKPEPAKPAPVEPEPAKPPKITDALEKAIVAPATPDDAPRSLVAEGSNYVRPLRRGLVLWGFAQAQYERNQISEDQLAPGGEPLNLNRFVLRRGRLRIDHGWENAAVTLELDASTVQGFGVGVRRAEGSLLYRGTTRDDVAPLLVLTAGVTDLPFGAEIGESQRDRLFTERSVGSLALFPTEADVGVKVWGARGFLNYALAVVNGQPAGPYQDKDDAKDIVGRVGVDARVHPLLRVDGGLSFYQGKGFSPGRDATKDSVIWIDDNNNGFAESFEIQGVTGSAAVASQNFDRWAAGLDLAASLRTPIGVSRLASEAVVAQNLDRGLFVSDPIQSGQHARQLVLAVSTVQQVTRWAALGFRAAYYDPNSDLLEQRAGVFFNKRESFWVLSPTLAFTLAHARVTAQYDVVDDRLARDERGVPVNAKNDQLTLRLQVDL